jgi:hypothetical protein
MEEGERPLVPWYLRTQQFINVVNVAETKVDGYYKKQEILITHKHNFAVNV